jgi:hypothetical protein
LVTSSLTSVVETPFVVDERERVPGETDTAGCAPVAGAVELLGRHPPDVVDIA